MIHAFQHLLDRQEIAELLYRRAIESSNGLFLQLKEDAGDCALEVTNILYDFPERDVALVESYFVAWPLMQEKNGQAIGGRFLDRTERGEKGWAIVHTHVVYDWSDYGLRIAARHAG